MPYMPCRPQLTIIQLTIILIFWGSTNAGMGRLGTATREEPRNAICKVLHLGVDSTQMYFNLLVLSLWKVQRHFFKAPFMLMPHWARTKWHIHHSRPIDSWNFVSGWLTEHFFGFESLICLIFTQFLCYLYSQDVPNLLHGFRSSHPLKDARVCFWATPLCTYRFAVACCLESTSETASSPWPHLLQSSWCHLRWAVLCCRSDLTAAKMPTSLAWKNWALSSRQGKWLLQDKCAIEIYWNTANWMLRLVWVSAALVYQRCQLLWEDWELKPGRHLQLWPERCGRRMTGSLGQCPWSWTRTCRYLQRIAKSCRRALSTSRLVPNWWRIEKNFGISTRQISDGVLVHSSSLSRPECRLQCHFPPWWHMHESEAVWQGAHGQTRSNKWDCRRHWHFGPPTTLPGQPLLHRIKSSQGITFWAERCPGTEPAQVADEPVLLSNDFCQSHLWWSIQLAYSKPCASKKWTKENIKMIVRIDTCGCDALPPTYGTHIAPTLATTSTYKGERENCAHTVYVTVHGAM